VTKILSRFTQCLFDWISSVVLERWRIARTATNHSTSSRECVGHGSSIYVVDQDVIFKGIGTTTRGAALHFAMSHSPRLLPALSLQVSVIIELLMYLVEADGARDATDLCSRSRPYICHTSSNSLEPSLSVCCFQDHLVCTLELKQPYLENIV
jgi:hypothetical protein